MPATVNTDNEGLLDIASSSVQWIELYTGERMANLWESTKAEAIAAFRPCVDIIQRDSMGNMLSPSEQQTNIEAANEAVAWIKTYTGESMRNSYSSSKEDAIGAFRRCADIVLKDALGNPLAPEQQKENIEAANEAVTWIRTYTGESMSRSFSSSKDEAIAAFQTCVDLISKDASGERIEYTQQRANIEAANEAVAWIKTYTGESMRSSWTSSKEEAIAAFRRCVDLIRFDGAGRPLSTEEQQDNIEAANTAISWIKAYAGESMGSLSEGSKRSAIEAFRTCADLIAKDSEGKTLSVEQMAANIEAAYEAISWIKTYTGESMRYASDAQKAQALEAYRAVVGPSQPEAVSELESEIARKDAEIASLKEQLLSQKEEANKAGQTIAEAQKALNKAQAASESAKREADKIISDAERKASEIVSKATQEADDIRAEAKRIAAESTLSSSVVQQADKSSNGTNDRQEKEGRFPENAPEAKDVSSSQPGAGEGGFWF